MKRRANFFCKMSFFVTFLKFSLVLHMIMCTSQSLTNMKGSFNNIKHINKRYKVLKNNQRFIFSYFTMIILSVLDYLLLFFPDRIMSTKTKLTYEKNYFLLFLTYTHM